MNKIKKYLLAFGLGTLLMMSVGMESKAEELKDENPNRLEEVTVVDEAGNVTIVEDVNGKLDESEISTASTRATAAQLVNFNTKGNATTNYTEYSTGAAGYTNGAYGADAAYLGTENGKIKFMLAGVVGLVSSSEVQVVNLSDATYVSYYYVSSGRLWHKVYTKITSGGVSSSLDQGAAPSYLSTGKEYYSYDGHYFYTNYATMIADYQKNVRTNSVNPKNPYYNYYQFLPLRSKVTYSTSTFKSLVDTKASSTSSKSKMIGLASSLVEYQNTYGVNAMIIAGVAANESTWGASTYALNRNNLFGLNAVDSDPDNASYFDSAAECARQFAETYMSKRYLRPGYWTYYGGFLGNKAAGINVKYASDPYWGEKAANWAWYIDKQGGSSDAGEYTLAVKDILPTSHTNYTVRAGSSTSSQSLYTTGKWSSYSMIVLNTTKENGFYKIQSDGVLNSGRTAVVDSTGVYDFSKMYAYMPGDNVTIVNSSSSGSSDSSTSTATYTTYKTTTSVNYRTGPGTSYSVAGKLASGTSIQVEDGYSKVANGYTWYRFKLNSKNYYIASNYVTKVTLSTPTLVSAKYSSGKVTVTWKKVSGAEGYYVYRKVSGGSWSKIKSISSASTLTYTDTSSLTEGKTYIYTVRAYVGSTLSGYNSTGVSVTIPETVKTYTYYKTTTSVNYRDNPGTSSSTVIGKLASGTLIAVEDGYSTTADGYTWYRFVKDGKEYYIASNYLTSTTGLNVVSNMVRYGGTDRYDTAIKAADGLKKSLGVSKFSSIIVASGENYPDALSGSYLAKVKKAPILLVSKNTETTVKNYIKNNLATGGKVYILGGTSAVRANFETLLKNNSISTERVWGKDRYLTNIAILKAAGVKNQDILVCSGKGFADSLSASAVGLPILLVSDTVSTTQQQYLSTLSSKNVYLIGGESAVSSTVSSTLSSKGYSVKRVAGYDRYETSAEVAETFFDKCDTIVLAYGMNFPDGLSGGPLAVSLNAPLVLVSDKSTSYANSYAHCAGATKAVVMGGKAVVSDSTVQKILK